MQQQEPFSERSPSAHPLSQPHFDDEATLLSARPVVPLAAVRTPARGKNKFLFAFAIALSALVGALGATLIYSRANATTQAHDSTVTTPAPTPVGEAIDTPAQQTDSNDSKDSVTEQPTAIAKPSVAKSLETDRERIHKTTTPVDKADKKKTEAKKPDTEDNTDEKFSREQREERRPRRVTERDRDKTLDNSSQDLFRIREIFEGPQRQRNRTRSAYPN